MSPRNCLILGSGRSGTSLLAGTLRLAGYYMGEHLIPADASNPKGYFEDDEINAINEGLLAQVTPPRSRPASGWRWLATVPVGTPIPCPPEIAKRIQTQIGNSPAAPRPSVPGGRNETNTARSPAAAGVACWAREVSPRPHSRGRIEVSCTGASSRGGRTLADEILAQQPNDPKERRA